MTIFLREINKENEHELALVTQRCMETVLETIPEFEGNPEKARLAFGNFTFAQMKEMIQGTLSSAVHRNLAAVDSDSDELVGHALFSIKIDSDGKKYGFCYSRYIVPAYRKKGIASMLLSQAEEWWTSLKAEYVVAHTHVSNLALQCLFQKHGFTLSEVKQGKFPYYELRKMLNNH
jgi:GNAT superfamily N-acetyltransferase